MPHPRLPAIRAAGRARCDPEASPSTRPTPCIFVATQTKVIQVEQPLGPITREPQAKVIQAIGRCYGTFDVYPILPSSPGAGGSHGHGSSSVPRTLAVRRRSPKQKEAPPRQCDRSHGGCQFQSTGPGCPRARGRTRLAGLLRSGASSEGSFGAPRSVRWAQDRGLCRPARLAWRRMCALTHSRRDGVRSRRGVILLVEPR